MFDISFDFDIT